MTTSDALIAELDVEAASTRRVLENVPEDRLSWRPHPKSMTLGQLALHVAITPGAIADFLAELHREVPVVPLPEPPSCAHLLATFDDSVARARSALARWNDHDLAAQWTMTRDGDIVLQLPRLGIIRTLLFNHFYHHRGQLTVYLRLVDAPVPGLYGPSADDKIAT